MAKFTVSFKPKGDQALERLARKTGTTKAEVIKRAIALYEYVDNEVDESKGRRLSITQDDAAVKDIIIH